MSCQCENLCLQHLDPCVKGLRTCFPITKRDSEPLSLIGNCDSKWLIGFLKRSNILYNNQQIIYKLMAVELHSIISGIHVLYLVIIQVFCLLPETNMA